MHSTRFLLIRHAESTWNAASRWQGQGDPPLSPRGEQQAGQLARQLVSTEIDLLMCSDLRRAVSTAAAIARAIGLQAQADRSFRELDVGTWTGLTRAEIEERDPLRLRRFEQEDRDVRPGGGETRREIRARVRRAVTELADKHPDRSVAVVTHLGAIRALLPGSSPDHCEVQLTSLAGILAAVERQA